MVISYFAASSFYALQLIWQRLGRWPLLVLLLGLYAWGSAAHKPVANAPSSSPQDTWAPHAGVPTNLAIPLEKRYLNLNPVLSLGLVLASPVNTTTVAVRLYQRQKALLYLLLGFVLSSGVFALVVWLAGTVPVVVWLAALQFFLLPLAFGWWCKPAYIQPAQLTFTAQGVCLQARQTQLSVAWEDLATYQVEFSLAKLAGAGYQLKLRDVQGHCVTLNVLEEEVVLPEGGLRPDSALAYLSRYIGWYNRQVATAGETALIGYRPSLLTRQTGTVLFTAWGLLLLVDLWLRWQHPTAKGTSLSMLGGALVLGLQALGHRQQGQRYARYLRDLEAAGLRAADAAP